LRENWTKCCVEWRHLQEIIFLELRRNGFVPASSSRSATKLLHSHPYWTEVVHKLYDAARGVKLNRVNWYVEGVQAGEMSPHPSLAMKPGFISLDT